MRLDRGLMHPYSLFSSDFYLQVFSCLKFLPPTLFQTASLVLNFFASDFQGTKLHNASFGDSFLTLILLKIACGVSLHGAGVTGSSICRKDGNHMGV